MLKIYKYLYRGLFIIFLLFTLLFISNKITAVEPINSNGFVSQDGVDLSVSIAKSLDGIRPIDSDFTQDDSIDLDGVNRYDMFYAYIKIDYKNNSGFDLINNNIEMQLPKQGDNGYYEPYTQYNSPANWVAYPNTPTGDGNSIFPAQNISFDVSNRILTWHGSLISDGSGGTVYIKIPMRDPYTKLGMFTYTPKFNYTKNNVSTSISENVSYTINGTNDQPYFSISKENNLGFIPNESDADEYYYIKYKLSTSFSSYFALPKRSYEFDRLLYLAKINFQIPPNSQLMVAPGASTISNNILSVDATNAHNSFIVLRYKKTEFSNPNQNVSLDGIFNGRFIGDLLPVKDVVGSNYELTHPIGTGSTIPTATLGDIVTTIQDFPISEDALKVGSVSFTYASNFTNRTNDTIRGNELLFEYNGVEFIKDNIPLPTDYGINMIHLQGALWTGTLDVNNPMSLSIIVKLDDGTTETLVSFTEAQLVNKNGGVLYSGNVPGVIGGYEALNGKIAKKVSIIVKNPPVGFKMQPFINGYVKNYPSTGADSLKLIRNTILYGDDLGSGRLVANGSGDKSNEVAIVKNTNFQPHFSIERTSTGTVNPGQLDSIKLQTTFSDKSKQSFVNPEFDILLPSGYTYDSYNDQTNETNSNNIAVFNLPDGRLKDNAPLIQTIPNYNSTGRMLVRIKYKGILQVHETLAGILSIKAAQYLSPGNYNIDGYFAAENIGTINNLSNTYTPYTIDANDMNGNGKVDDYIFGTVNKSLSISNGVGVSLYSQVKGSFDPAFTGQGTTKQNTNIDGALTLEYNGSTPINNIQLVSILPYEGDGKTLYGDAENGQRVTLSQPVDVSSYPGATVYYNNTPTNYPLDSGWSTTYTNNARAVRIVFSPEFELVNGGLEKTSVILKLNVPGTTDSTQLTSVQGVGFLPIKLFSNRDIAGMDGATSNITSLALGVFVKVFNDDNANGIKDNNELWSNNTNVDIFNIGDDITTSQPLYSGTTDENGVISFIDSFNGVNFNLQGYRVVVHASTGDVSFISGIGDVTTDSNGQQGVVFNTSNQLVNVIAGLIPETMTINGNYWQDYEASPNGIKDAHDLISNTLDRTVRLFNVTDNVYESISTKVQSDGSYILPNVVIGPEYRVEFFYNSTTEVPSIIAENVVSKYANNILGYTFNSSGMNQDDVRTVNAAVIENGSINIRFSTDGSNTIGSIYNLIRSLPTTYTANVGTSEDTSNQTSGTFVVPSGYRLVTNEQTSKIVTINNTSKSQDVIFMVELLESNLSGVKTSIPSSNPLKANDTIRYEIEVTNSGTIDADNVEISDVVPLNSELVNINDGGVIDSNNKITWTIPTIAQAGGSTKVSFEVKVLEVKNVGSYNIVNDKAKVNGISINSTKNTVNQGLLSYGKSSQYTNYKELLPNDRIDYTIKVSNIGNATLNDIIVSDVIPQNTTYISKSVNDNGVYKDGKILAEIKSLEAKKSVVIKFSVKINNNVKKGTVIENVALVNGNKTNKVSHSIGTKEDNIYVEKIPNTGTNIFFITSILLFIGTHLLILNKLFNKSKIKVTRI